jgi:hypothetical protein
MPEQDFEVTLYDAIFEEMIDIDALKKITFKLAESYRYCNPEPDTGYAGGFEIERALFTPSHSGDQIGFLIARAVREAIYKQANEHRQQLTQDDDCEI